MIRDRIELYSARPFSKSYYIPYPELWLADVINQSYFFMSGFGIVNWKAIYLLQQIKVTLADSSKDSKYSQHPLPPIKQVALSPVSPFTKMKIILALQTPPFNNTTETWGVYCSLY